LLPYIVIEGLVRVQGTTDKMLCLQYGAVFKFNPFGLVVFYDYPFDHATTDNPASFFRDVFTEKVGYMVGTHVAKPEMPGAVYHEG